MNAVIKQLVEVELFISMILDIKTLSLTHIYYIHILISLSNDVGKHTALKAFHRSSVTAAPYFIASK